jgi:hypothetical protein
VSSWSGGVCVTDVTRQRPGEDLRPAGTAICLGDHRHACYPTSDAAHRARDLRGDRRASCGECWAIRPGQLHRCALSPHSRPQTVVNFPRRIHRCLRSPSCVHRCTVARLARTGKSRHAYPPHRGPEATSRGPMFGPAHGRSACRWIACSIAVNTAILCYCRTCARGSNIPGLARGPARGRPACRSNTADTAILRYCTVGKRVRPAPVARSSDARTACQHAATVCGNAAGAGILPG